MEAAMRVYVKHFQSATRAGYIAECCADPAKAKKELDWQAS